MPRQSTQRFLFIVAPLLFAYVCVSRHPVFINYLTGQLPAVSALLTIECLLLPSSLTARDSSASLQLHHRYAPLIVGAAILGHHAVEARLRVVNTENFENTSYYGSPVSLDGKNIFIMLDESANHTNVTWRFNSAWAIQLDKCDRDEFAKIEISDSCKWKFAWDDERDFVLIGNDEEEHPWSFKKLPQPVRKLRIEIGKDSPSMAVSAVTDAGDSQKIDGDLALTSAGYCMLTTGNFSVNVNLTRPGCPINVTIMDAELLYDFYEPPTVPPPTVPQNSSATPSNNTTKSSSSGEKAGLPTWAIIVAGGVGGLLVLVAVVGLIVFCCVRRRRHPPPAQFDDDPNIDAQASRMPMN